LLGFYRNEILNGIEVCKALYNKMKTTDEKGAIFILVVIKIFMHVFTILFGGYGIFRDELYYLACANHLSFGYVDQPPFSIWVLSAVTQVFGDSWQMIRLVPALVGGASVYFLIKTVKRLDGKPLAYWIAGIAFICAPINIGYASIYSMNSFDIFFWILSLYLLLATLKRPEDVKNWVILGVIVGLGLMNKISMAWFCIGTCLFMLVGPYRPLLKTKGPYVAVIISALMFAPFIIWNINHDMAHVEFASNASNHKYGSITRMDFISGQIMQELPFTLVLVIFSVYYLFSRRTSWLEKLPSFVFVATCFILLIKGHVKSEYMAAAYSLIIISGAIYVANSIQKRWHKIVLWTLLFAHILLGIVAFPLASPLLPEPTLVSYRKKLGVSEKNNEGNDEAELPQFYADMHGWEEFAKTVWEASKLLSEDEKRHTTVWVNNYGEAGALEYFSDKYKVPPVLSRHNNYYLWGLETIRKNDFKIFIIIDGDLDSHKNALKEVEQVGTFRCSYCMPYENNKPIFIGKYPKENINLEELFTREKNYM